MASVQQVRTLTEELFRGGSITRKQRGAILGRLEGSSSYAEVEPQKLHAEVLDGMPSAVVTRFVQLGRGGVASRETRELSSASMRR